MSKPPTGVRGRRVLVAPPPPPAPRHGSWARAERLALMRRSVRLPVEATPLGGLGWRATVIFLCCLAGFGDSIYLTLVHYTSLVPLVCHSTGPIDCAEVVTSPESVIFGIPVAVYGLIFFFAMVIICSPPAWRRADPLLAPVRLGASTIGLGFVAYLLYTELYVIGKICIWCSVAHLMTFVIFMLVITGWDQLRAIAGPEDGPLGMDASDEDGGEDES